MHFWRTIRDHLYPSRYNAHRPRLLRRGWLLSFLGVALVCEGVILGGAISAPGPNVFLAAVVQSEVVEFTQAARAKEVGLPLAISDVLSAAAYAKAEDMARYGYFSHTGPNGEEPWVWLDRAGYSYMYAGENLAVRFEESKDVVDAWMASAGHRANIIKPQYTEVGVGIAEGTYKGGPATFVVQYFAAPTATVVAQPRVSQVPPVEDEARVAGAQTPPEAATPAQEPAAGSQSHSLLRSIQSAIGSMPDAAAWALAGAAGVLIAVLALTFFIRIQVQPTDLLMPGAAVAVVMLTFLAVNAVYMPGSQSASVSLAQGEIAAPAATGTPAFPEATERY